MKPWLMALVAFLWTGAAQAGTLLNPDWSSPVARKYLSLHVAHAAQFEFTLSFEPHGPRSPDFSLPVLGLVRGFQAANPAQATSNLFIAPLTVSTMGWWPKCATEKPIVGNASDLTRTWYSKSYDFGCLEVSISGDRNTSSDIPASLRDDIHPTDDVFSVTDEGGNSTAIPPVTYDITRFGIPYSITIECYLESREFCRDFAAQKLLLDRLSIIQGNSN